MLTQDSTRSDVSEKICGSAGDSDPELVSEALREQRDFRSHCSEMMPDDGPYFDTAKLRACRTNSVRNASGAVKMARWPTANTFSHAR